MAHLQQIESHLVMLRLYLRSAVWIGQNLRSAKHGSELRSMTMLGNPRSPLGVNNTLQDRCGCSPPDHLLLYSWIEQMIGFHHQVAKLRP